MSSFKIICTHFYATINACGLDLRFKREKKIEMAGKKMTSTSAALSKCGRDFEQMYMVYGSQLRIRGSFINFRHCHNENYLNIEYYFNSTNNFYLLSVLAHK